MPADTELWAGIWEAEVAAAALPTGNVLLDEDAVFDVVYDLEPFRHLLATTH